MKANAVSHLLSSLVWIDQYNDMQQNDNFHGIHAYRVEMKEPGNSWPTRLKKASGGGNTATIKASSNYSPSRYELPLQQTLLSQLIEKLFTLFCVYGLSAGKVWLFICVSVFQRSTSMKRLPWSVLHEVSRLKCLPWSVYMMCLIQCLYQGHWLKNIPGKLVWITLRCRICCGACVTKVIWR